MRQNPEMFVYYKTRPTNMLIYRRERLQNLIIDVKHPCRVRKMEISTNKKP